MTKYITTIGRTVYFPSEQFIKDNEMASMIVLTHEIVHISQHNKYGKIPYSLMYLFPQCLALLALGAIFAVFWLPMLWCLVFLAFLAPIPAPWRTKFEVEGYTMSLFMISMVYKNKFTPEKIKKALLKQASLINYGDFKGPNYWFMWPFGVSDIFKKKINDISSGVISDTDEVYGRVSRSYLNAVTAYEL